MRGLAGTARAEHSCRRRNIYRCHDCNWTHSSEGSFSNFSIYNLKKKRGSPAKCPLIVPVEQGQGTLTQCPSEWGEERETTKPLKHMRVSSTWR